MASIFQWLLWWTQPPMVVLEPGSSCTAIRQATTGPLWHTNQRQGHRSRVNVVPRRCTGVRHQEWTCFSSRAVSASDDAARSYSCTQTCWSEALDEGTCCCRVFPRWTWTPHAAGNSHHLPVHTQTLPVLSVSVLLACCSQVIPG